MSSDLEVRHLSQSYILAALRDACAALYPEEQTTRVIVADAGLDERQIAFSTRAQTNWHNILAEAIRGNGLDALLDVVHTAYPINQPLQTAIASYHQFIEVAGHLDVPTQLPVGFDPYDIDGLVNPYLGLRPFSYDDRAIYGGREQLAQETIQRLTKPGTQKTILFITGASGSGKSSFAQAGLIPLLESHYAAYQKTVRHAIFRPSSHPLVMLADALQKLNPDRQTEFLTETQFVDHLAPTSPTQINLLLIDQFEELFIQSEASQRSPFCTFLINLPDFTACHTHILITLRVDYLDELFAIQPLWAIAKEGVELRTMKADDLRSAIQKPLQVSHPTKRFAPELLERLVQDGGADSALLPLLQVTLAELWKTGKLVLSNYHSLTDAIRQRAELVYTFSDHANADPKTARPAQEQQALMSILLDLINVSADGADRREARQRRTRQELEQASPQRSRLIEELVNARLLSAASEARNSEDVEVIDIIHESLIDNWDRLRQAIEEQRQQLQRRARFKLWLGEWLRNGRQDGYLLLTDMQLAEARALVEGHDIEVRGSEARELYQYSLDWREVERQKELQQIKALAEAQQRRAQTFRWALVVATTLTLLALTATGIAVNRQQVAIDALATATVAQGQAVAESERAIAEQYHARATELIAHARRVQTESPQQSILLAIEAHAIPQGDAQQPLPAAIEEVRAAIERFSGYTPNCDTGSTKAVDVSADSRWLVALGSENGIACLWDLTSRSPASLPSHLLPHSTQVNQALFSPNSHWLVTQDYYSVIQLFDLHAADPATTPHLLQENAYIVGFSADNRWLVTVSDDTYIYLWQVMEGTITDSPVVLKSTPFYDIKLYNQWLVTTIGFGSQFQLWDLASNAPNTFPIILQNGAESFPDSMFFSPDRRWLSVYSFGLPIELWDLAAPTPRHFSIGSSSEYLIEAGTITPDGDWLITGGNDGNIRFWDLTAPDPSVSPILFDNFQHSVNTLAISTDNHWLLTDGTGEEPVLWELTTPISLTKPIVLTGLDPQVGLSIISGNPYAEAAHFSPDNRWLAIPVNNTIRLWDLTLEDPRTDPIVLGGYDAAIIDFRFSPDGHWLFATDGYTVRLWGLSTCDPAASPYLLTCIQGSGGEFTFTPDNKQLVVSTLFTDVHIIDLTSATPMYADLILESPADGVKSVAVSQNDRWLVTITVNGVIQRWDRRSLVAHSVPIQELGPPNCLHSSIRDRMISPDARWVVIHCHEGGSTLWDLATRETSYQPIDLSVRESSIATLVAFAFSSGSRWLVTTYMDGVVQLRDLQVLHPSLTVQTLLGHQGPVTRIAISADERWLVTVGHSKLGNPFETDTRLWDLQAHSSTEASLLLANLSKGVERLEISTNSRWLVALDEFDKIWVYDLTSDNPNRSSFLLPEAVDRVQSFMISSDSQQLITVHDKVTYLWNLAAPDSAIAPLALFNYEGFGDKVAISPNGRWLLTSDVKTVDEKQNVRIWDLLASDPQTSAIVLGSHQGEVESIAISADSRWAVSIGLKNDLHLWDLQMSEVIRRACYVVNRNFTWDEWQTYMEGNYRPTCPNALIPMDVLTVISDEASQQIRSGEIPSATQRLNQLNGWLQMNGQFKSYGVQVPAFVAEVSATATAEAQPAQ